MSAWRFVILTCFFLVSVGAQAQMRCEEIFTSREMIVRAIHDLAELRIRIDISQANGVLGPRMTSMRSAYINKEMQLVRYLEDHQIMTAAELSSKIKNEIAKAQGLKQEPPAEEIQKIAEHRAMVQNYRTDGSRINMAILDVRSYPNTRLTPKEPFALALVPTTQIVWRRVVEAIHKKYPTRLSVGGISVWSGKFDRLNPDPSKFKGELNPVEQVSMKDVELWIAALNDLAQEESPLIREILPDHRPGTVYRLPLYRDYAFLLDAVSALTLNQEALEKRSWYAGNSGEQTHPVAQKEPFDVGGEDFYDIIGNVAEMAGDQGHNSSGYLRWMAIGMEYNTLPFKGSYHDRVVEIQPKTRHSNLGFRLASTVP